jgi:hypothetical protein
MTAIVCPEIKKQYVDANGDPLSGGKLHVYESGTTTPVNSYTTKDADVANANPIILNSRGEVETGPFLNAGSYKFVLTDSDDVTIWTQDNIVIRDFGTEIDAIEVSIAESEVSTLAPNRLISGENSDNSSAPRFLLPVASNNQVKILATSTDLVYSVEGTQYTLDSDTVASGLLSPPTSNNTADINDSVVSEQDYVKTLGMFGTSIPIDNIGSEITSLNGKLAAFKIEGSDVEYIIARVDSTNSRLIEVVRGCFYDSNGNLTVSKAFADDDTVTLMKLTWIYLNTSGQMIVSYNEPFYSTTQPSSPTDGDMWYDLTNKKWKRFNSTAFADASVTFLGTCIQDENDVTVGARPEFFHASYNEDNSISLEYVSATQVRSRENNNCINVNGFSYVLKDSFITWDITSHLESGESEDSDLTFFCYLDEGGDPKMSTKPPIELEGRLKGSYHPSEMWRYVGSIYNDENDDFVESSLVKSEKESIFDSSLIKSEQGSGNTINLTHFDRYVFCDVLSGAVTVNLPSAKNVESKKITIKRNDVFGGIRKDLTDSEVTTGTDNLNIDGHGFTTGKKVRISNSGGAVPTGLAVLTDYYVIVVDVDNIKLASSRANADSGTPIDITAASGGGTHTIEPQENSLTINPVSGQTIEGESSKLLYGENEIIELLSDGSNWELLHRDNGNNITESEIIIGKWDNETLYRRFFREESRADGLTIVTGVSNLISTVGWSKVGSFKRTMNYGISGTFSRVDFDDAAGDLEINSSASYVSEFYVDYTKS